MATKLYVLLLHGTWAGAARWTQEGSPFRTELRARLARHGYDPRFECFPWNGKNRWSGRALVTEKVNRQLDDAKAERDHRWEFLVVAHSHGGNIATEAVRERLRVDPGLPIRGVVCLNTPFLLREVRGGNGFLLVWLAIALLLLALLCLRGEFERRFQVPGILSQLAPGATTLSRLPIGWSLAGLALVIAVLLALSHQLRRRASRDREELRPDVLCLSCPDDEAITFLGLGEGIANLPQLLLHPVALVLACGLSALVAWYTGKLGACVSDSGCWLGLVSVLFFAWVAMALAGGLLGALVVTLLFGLPPLQILHTLVSRVLVSYVPLRPANAVFRGISGLDLQWGNPLQLFHSAIYRSEQTIEEICTWLTNKSEPRAGGKVKV